jgi:cytochrome c peroxidase
MARILVALILAAFTSSLGYAMLHAQQDDQIPNNLPHRNPGGYGATFSTQGHIDLTGEYFRAQGSNGRSCGSCHIPEEAWAITPATLQRLFDETQGLHPVFNRLDANNATLPLGTVEEKLAAYSMMLSRGVFRRGGTPRADSQWELVAADDPHGFANLNRLVHWRRSMPTINFALGSTTVNWDGGNSISDDQHANLVNQATRNITGAQERLLTQGPLLPHVIPEIVAFEESLSTAQLIVLGVGRLDDDGARGGPEALASMTKRSGPFDLYDAWRGSDNPRRAQIARGQDLFNERGCRSCHDSANNGTNTQNKLFNIGTASAAVRTPDLPLYTFRNRTTLEEIQLTDAGRGQVTGRWDDLGSFKTPTIRGLAARAPYFHNGIAATLEAVVRFYEDHLNFRFTDAERADLVAFLNAL